MSNIILNPVSAQTLTGSGSVQAPSLPSGVKAVKFSVEGADVRYWMHGEDPGSSDGHVALANSYETISNVILSNLKFYIPGSAKVSITSFV